MRSKSIFPALISKSPRIKSNNNQDISIEALSVITIERAFFYILFCVKALFWFVFSILLFLIPFVFRADGDFCLNKKTAFIAVRLFGLRVFSLLLYFAPDGVYYSIFGKRGKRIHPEGDERKKKKASFSISVDAIKFTNISVKFHIGGNVDDVSVACGTVTAFADSVFAYLKEKDLLDKGRVIVLPSYTADQMTANFSISGFTAPIKVLSSLVHTKNGEKYAKRRYREHNG